MTGTRGKDDGGRDGFSDTPVFGTVEVHPTGHFQERFEERIGDLMPEVDPNHSFEASGFLVKDGRKGCWFFDVPGVGRFVLQRLQRAFTGITVLPQLHCYPELGEA